MQVKSGRARGQALTEMMVILPVFLIIFWAVIWVIQTSVVNERLQVAVRYSGLVSSQVDPYMEYSLFTMYNNLLSKNSVQPDACSSPSSDALTNTGSYPGPQTGTFFQPRSGSIVSTCNATTVAQTSLTLSRNEIFLHDSAAITAQTTVPQLLTAVLGESVTQLQAQQNFFAAPDLGTILHCYPELNAAIATSLKPSIGSTPPSSPPTPLPSSFSSNALNVSGNCTN